MQQPALYVVTEPQGSIMEQQAVMVARVSSEEVLGRTISTHVGLIVIAWWTKTNGTSADIVDSRSALELA